jgi:Concanavalin A-like lectin/glucanases superfamily
MMIVDHSALMWGDASVVASAALASNPTLLLHARSATPGTPDLSLPVAPAGTTWRPGTATGADSADPVFTTNRWTFDGVDDELSILASASSPSMAAATPFTLMVVTRRSANNGGRIVVSSRGASSTGRGFRMNVTSTGQLVSQLSDGTNLVSVQTSTTEPLNVRVVSWVYTVTSNTQIRYRSNGVVGTTVTRTGNDETGTALAGATWRIGRHLSSQANYFAGDVYAFALWNRSLSSAEMDAIETEYGAGT